MNLFLELQSIFEKFLSIFPGFLHPVISIALAILLIYSVIQVIKKQFIWIILLVILLPASIPIFNHVIGFLISVLKYLLGI